MCASSDQLHHLELDVVTKRDSGLYAGALYRCYQTPSGEQNRTLAMVTRRAYVTARAAAEAINAAHPTLKPINLSELPDEQEPEFPNVTSGQTFVLVIPKHRDSEDDRPRVMCGQQEVMSYNQLRLLVDAGLVREESPSGEDVGLSCVYKEFIANPIH